MEWPTIERILSISAMLLSTATGAGILYLSYRKSKPEINQIEANTEKVNAEIEKTNAENDNDQATAAEKMLLVTRMYAEEVSKLREEQEIMRRKNEERFKEISETRERERREYLEKFTLQEIELAGLRESNADLAEWAERLVYQVKSMGGIPVEMRKRK